MRRLVPLVLLLAMLNPAPVPAADEPAGLDRKVSLDVKSVALRTALTSFPFGPDLRAEVAADVPNVNLDLGFRNLKLQTGLDLLIAAAGEQVDRITGGWQKDARGKWVYRIELNKATPLISLNLQSVPLREAIRRLFENSAEQYSLDPGVPNVLITLRLERVTLPKALRLILREAAKQVPGITVSKG